MKDIDFDELDRAVSSVLSKKSTPTDNSASVPVETSSNAPSSAGNAPVQSPTPEPVAVNEPQTITIDTSSTTSGLSSSAPEVAATNTTSPITLRPRGKFMDVMHPSADMNPTTSAGSRPAFTPPRTLAPLTARDVDQPEQAEPTATVDEASALIGAEPAPVSDTPEEMATVHDEPEETFLLPAETEDEDETISSDETAPDMTSSYVDPLDVAMETSAAAPEETIRPENVSQPTPFLSDTKVDKRPLGAFVDGEEQDAELPKNPANDDTQTAPVVPLPRELQPDVVQVESVQEPDQSTTATDKPFAAPVSVATDSVDDGRVEGHPLFDTSTYHEPIAAVHTKKTAPWVFWVVGLGICLVIGAGVGYFLFTAGF